MSAYNSHGSGSGYHAISNQYGLPNPPSTVDELNIAGRNGSPIYPSHIGNYVPTGTAPSSIPSGSHGNLNLTPSTAAYGYHAVPDNACLRIAANHRPVDNAHLPDNAYLHPTENHGSVDNTYLPDDAYLRTTTNHGSVDNTHLRPTESHSPANYSSSSTVDKSLNDHDSEPSPLPQLPSVANVQLRAYPEILDSVIDNRDGSLTPDRQLVIVRVLMRMRENPECPVPEFLLHPPDHNDKEARDLYLLIARWYKLQYPQIKALGEFPVSLDTLRGRYRAYTCPAEQRPRKPAPWSEEQIRIMLAAKEMVEKEIAHAQEVRRRGEPKPNFSWTQVGARMEELGVTQHFHPTVISRQFRKVEAKKAAQGNGA